MGREYLENGGRTGTLGRIEGATHVPSETRPLTQSKRAGLQRLSEGKADYFAMVHAGSNGMTMARLVELGLARELGDGFAGHEWEITEDGRQALANGWFVVVSPD